MSFPGYSHVLEEQLVDSRVMICGAFLIDAVNFSALRQELF